MKRPVIFCIKSLSEPHRCQECGVSWVCSSVAGRGNPFQGPKLGSCLTLGNELSKETHVLTKQEILLGKGTWWRAVGKGTQENCSAL